MNQEHNPCPKTCVVTGGAGFLGSHLCEYLVEKGFRVIAIDNLLTGSADNLKYVYGNKLFKFIYSDVSDYIYIEGPVDYVFHFASPASPVDYLKYPIQTLKVGGLGTHKALGLAKAKKAVFVLASTSEVYGDPLEHPQKETYWGNVNPVGSRGVYDEAKRFAEAMTMAYNKEHGVDTRIARIFNTYGPRMRLDDGRVIPSFIKSVINGSGFTVFGNGSQTRSFCYVSDLIEGIFRLANVYYHLPVNLGNPSEISVVDLANEVKRITGAQGNIVFKPLPEDDPKVRKPDITLAQEILKWEPEVAFEDGFSRTIAWFKENTAVVL